MNREEAGPLFAPKNVLRAVAVMHVPIDHQHAIELQFVQRRAGRHRHIAEQAKAHRAGGQGMMSRRPDQAKRPAVFAPHHASDCVGRGAGCQLGRDKGLLAAAGVILDLTAAGGREPFDFANVVGCMHPGELVDRCQRTFGLC